MRISTAILTLGICALVGLRGDSQETEELDDLWMTAPTIVVGDNDQAWLEGPGASDLNAFLVNGTKFTIRKGKINFSSEKSDTIQFKAYTKTGMVLTKKYIRPFKTEVDDLEEQ